jgi:hypothetical protein
MYFLYVSPIFFYTYAITYSYSDIVYKMDSHQNQIIQSLKAFSDLYYKHITIVSDTTIWCLYYKRL